MTNTSLECEVFEAFVASPSSTNWATATEEEENTSPPASPSSSSRYPGVFVARRRRDGATSPVSSIASTTKSPTTTTARNSRRSKKLFVHAPYSISSSSIGPEESDEEEDDDENDSRTSSPRSLSPTSINRSSPPTPSTTPPPMFLHQPVPTVPQAHPSFLHPNFPFFHSPPSPVPSPPPFTDSPPPCYDPSLYAGLDEARSSCMTPPPPCPSPQQQQQQQQQQVPHHLMCPPPLPSTDGFPPLNLPFPFPPEAMQQLMEPQRPLITDEQLGAIDPVRYKTRICRNWQREGKCPYSEKCLFAHGPTEIRTCFDNHSALASIGKLPHYVYLGSSENDGVGWPAYPVKPFNKLDDFLKNLEDFVLAYGADDGVNVVRGMVEECS